MGQEVEDFIGLAAVTEGEDHITRGDQAEIAMEGVLGVENHGGGAGAVQGGGDFVGDVAGFANTADDDFPAGADGGAEEFHGIDE